MIFGIPLTPFNVIAFCILALTIWVALVRYSHGTSSNLPLLYWLGIVAHMKFFEGGYDPKWVFGGAVCALIVRFEFISPGLTKLFQLGELTAIGYVLWRTVGLILLW
jgi:hypothetical protein